MDTTDSWFASCLLTRRRLEAISQIAGVGLNTLRYWMGRHWATARDCSAAGGSWAPAFRVRELTKVYGAGPSRIAGGLRTGRKTRRILTCRSVLALSSVGDWVEPKTAVRGRPCTRARHPAMIGSD
jgi:hypothetical protein